MQLLFEWRKKVKLLVVQSCPTLCDPMDCRWPCSPVHGIIQAQIPEWVAISFSRDLPNTRMEPASLALQAESLPSEPLTHENRQEYTMEKEQSFQ